jgi:hypothetical protein
MKSPEAVLRTALVTNTAVSSLVGAKVFPVQAPVKDHLGNAVNLPFVTWRRTGIRREQTLKNPMGIPRVTLDFSVYGATYDQARDVADAMRLVLEGYGGTSDNTTVEQASLENETDDFVSLAGAELPPAYQITQTYDVWWQES